MIEDMRLHDFAPKTEEAYVHAVAALAKYHNRSPELLGEEDIREYFVYLVEERKLAKSTVRQHLCGTKFFYETTLGRQWEVFDLVKPKRGRKLPVVLSREQIARLFEVVRSTQHRAGMLLGYTCGLRVSEVAGLRLAHIDGDRRQIRVVEGKGRKDRYVPVAPRVLCQGRRDSQACDVSYAASLLWNPPAGVRG